MDNYIFYKLFILLFLVILNNVFSSFWFFERRQGMLIDAISHSVLPILVLVFLLVRSLDSFAFVFFSILVSTIITYFISNLSKFSLKHSQSIIGVFFSGFFAMGLILTNIFAANTHLDPDSVLFGALEFSLFENINLLGYTMPVAIFKMSLLLIFNILVYNFCKRLFSELSFDDKSLGIRGFNTSLVDFLQLGVLVTNVILSFELVGVILTLGLNVIPILCARLFYYKSDQLISFAILLSTFVLFVSSFFAFSFNLSISALFIVFMGFVFLSLFFLKDYFIKL